MMLYLMTSPPPPPTSPGPRSPSRFGRLPIGGKGKKTAFIIGAIVIAAIVIGIIVAIIVSQQSPSNTTISSSAPNVKFIKFDLQNQEIKVGASTNLVFNVENREDRVIDDARVVITVQPQAGSNYLAISNQTIDLSVLPTNARTGEKVVSITATGTPALEAVYTIQGILTVDGTQTDIKDLSLTIKQ
jgi:hypothetical protein